MKKLPIGAKEIHWLEVALRLTHVDQIKSALTLAQYPRDTVFVREGEKSQGLYVLYQGRVVVSKIRPKTGVSVPFRALTATVTATEPCTVFLLDAEQVLALLKKRPDLSVRLHWKAGERLGELDWLQNF
jgi:CRP-like cAMP-binding protein